MRSFIFSLAMAVAISGSAVQANNSHAEANSTAQLIANNLKESGKLKDYRVGVKYEDGVAWLVGSVKSDQQKAIAEAIARSSTGVDHVVSKLEVENAGAPADESVKLASKQTENAPATRQPMPAPAAQPQQSARGSNNMPMPYARSAGQAQGVSPAAYAQQQAQQAQYCPPGAYGPEGAGPMPMGPQPGGATGQSVSYDNPQVPGYAWPSYASSPNYAALTYPKQYSPSAWPYIGPFYPYPQVPLGWRKVTLEWDDGWWFLDFKDCQHCR